ncbi:MAG: hypothetical protein QXT20_04525 [Candidatus Woesearchaeota archaeon]
MRRHIGIFKDWKMILIFAGASLVLAVAAFNTKNVFLKFLNIVSWSVLSFYLYKDVFGLVNLLDMSNDFLLWILRIIGGIVGFIGLFFGGIMFFMGLAMNADPLTMGLSILFFGLGFLGAFMVFRSHRRYAHLYVNR